MTVRAVKQCIRCKKNIRVDAPIWIEATGRRRKDGIDFGIAVMSHLKCLDKGMPVDVAVFDE